LAVCGDEYHGGKMFQLYLPLPVRLVTRLQPEFKIRFPWNNLEQEFENFGQKLKIWSSIEILVKNRNFVQKSTF